MRSNIGDGGAGASADGNVDDPVVAAVTAALDLLRATPPTPAPP